jgi:hypothetical protein
MKRLSSIETDCVQLEVGECDCGYHFTADATFLEQVGDFIFNCPSCGKTINTMGIFPPEVKDERGEEPEEGFWCPKCGYVGLGDCWCKDGTV